MSIHIGAEKGAIAERVLFPGDPLRAKYIADTFLKDVVQYNAVRGMLGFTGTIRNDGQRVSVQGSGMGMPSLPLYAHQLITQYGVKEIIRVGTCGSLQADLRVGDVVLAQGACSESNLNRRRFKGMDYAPLANWELLRRAYEYADSVDGPIRVGNILSADLFYNDIDPDEWKVWASYGVLAVEMESAELYTVSARLGARALSILTVSDNLADKENTAMSPADREGSLNRMVRIALAI